MTMRVAPGDAVLTRYGAGVVVRTFDRLDGEGDGDDAKTVPPTWASVRLWRRPGESVASGAAATLRVEDCVSKRIAAAPGAVVRARDEVGREGVTTAAGEDGRGERLYVIERHLPSEDAFLASPIDDADDGGGGGGSDGGGGSRSLARSLAVMSGGSPRPPSARGDDPISEATSQARRRPAERRCRLRPEQITSTSAKFYPVLEELAARGEAAWERSASLDVDISGVADALTSAVKITDARGEEVAVGDIGEAIAAGAAGDGVAKALSEASKSSMCALNDKLGENGANAIPHAAANVTAKEALETAAERAKNVSAAATEGLSLPEAREVQQIYEMLRDEDLTKLFKMGKERLAELVEVEIPERTKKALGAMGIELDDGRHADAVENGKRSIAGGMKKLRKDALASLDQMLKMNAEDGNIVLRASGGAVKIDTRKILDPSLLPRSSAQAARFASVFDQLSKAAASDPRLTDIFSSISDRTKTWQEMTGRLLQTKTASLFAEGSQRLRARAADLLSIAPGQLKDAFGGAGGGGGGDLTRAFTEGDVAMAKLKSMEMGDAVRRRLFAAIELRSESSGGLDAVIAGSLAAIQQKGSAYGTRTEALLGRGGLEDLTLSSVAERARAAAGSKGGVSEDSIQSVITKVQGSATSAMKGTKETLIALLSRRSGYRDAVLLRLERVFLDLESQLGEDMTAEQIAGLVGGEGGSLALFQPVAAKAAKEIEVQLDAAEAKMRESKHWNPKAENVTNKVRQIARGELSMADVLDMAAGYLDDEEVAARSGGLIVKAESLLDNFEAASARLGEAGNAASRGRNRAGPGIMDAVAKAGITKDAVMKGVEGLDVDKLLDDTKSAVTDEAARRELISGAGDAALDFLLKILPSMPVPPFDGVREGLVYHLSNLSMAGFRMKKEDIYIEIAGIKAAAGRKVGNGNGNNFPQSRMAVKASELLVIDVRNISATLDDAEWSFEQTYMPYLRGSGKANTRLWDGAIRLKFELRRRILNAGETDPVTGIPLNPTWEPVLCLNDRSCTIGGIELTIQGASRIAWVANKLVSALKNPLRDYVVSVIVNALKTHSGWLVDVLNRNLSPYWDFVLRTAKLELNDLPKLARHHVVEAEKVPADAEGMVELVWRERVPLGLNILTNDESGYLKIIDFPRGTQARKVASEKRLDPDSFKGATITSVNGRRYGPEQQVDLFAALKDPARPKTILFKLASADELERIEGVMEKGKSGGASRKGEDKAAGKEREDGSDANLVMVVEIADQGDIGLRLAAAGDDFGLVVNGFLRDPSGRPLPAERTGRIRKNDLLSHVDGTLVLGPDGAGGRRALELLERAGPTRRPLRLGFAKPYLHHVSFERPGSDGVSEGGSFGGPEELVLAEAKSANNDVGIVLKGYASVEGAAEAGGVFVGDNLAFINGIPVGAGCRLFDGSSPSPKLGEVIQMLKQYSPLALTFARAQAKSKASTMKSYLISSPLSLDIELAYTFSIPAENHDHLGCRFVTGMNGSDVVVESVSGVEGPFQRRMRETGLPLLGCRLEAVDGEAVPSYVNPRMAVNAVKRRWAADGRVELTFCDERHRNALREMKSLNGSSS